MLTREVLLRLTVTGCLCVCLGAVAGCLCTQADIRCLRAITAQNRTYASLDRVARLRSRGEVLVQARGEHRESGSGGCGLFEWPLR
jgi:hypothetical protein